jgi:Family of unknown function (DUF5906)
MPMKVTEAIQAFLKRNPLVLSHQKDLIERYTPEMEVQVNVLPGNGVPSENGKSYSSEEYQEPWFPIRIPKNARTTPEFRDYELRWPLEVHAECIGMTGWNFEKRLSMHVGFDFDAICGNSHLKSGITQEELDRVREAAMAIPWVETRKSTGGGGLHLRVHLGKGIPTANHTEHAALGRAILGLMSREAGFNFADGVDPAACGGNLWIWHRKVTTENQGLSIIKAATDSPDVPENWRDHIEVINRKRRRVKVQGVPESAQADFENRAEASKHTQLDDSHKKLMDWLIDHGYTCVWEPDHYMLRTHTYALAEAHERLGMRGFFKTLATGSDGRSDHNCYCFPKPNGGWRVVRYGEGCLEADTWIQDGANWTYCYLNQQPDLQSAALAKGGVKDDDGGFVFPSLLVASEVAQMLGGSLSITEGLEDRQTKLKPAKDGSGLVVEVKKEKDDDVDGYIDKKGVHKKVISALLPKYSEDAQGYDNDIRYLRTIANKDAGWVLNIQGEWCTQSKDNIISALMSKGMTSADAKATTGCIIYDSWTLANLPFKPEYPGGRIWNKDAAQFRYTPLQEDSGLHPHWDKVLAHCGKGINSCVGFNPWCQKTGIFSGGDYLKYWIASMFQYPFEPLPYLFFFSEPYQNCGKSTFHQAVSQLLTKGVMRADQALQSSGNFNGELMSAILCVVEETDLSKAGQRAYDKIKDWVTSREVSIHVKNLTPYMQPNTSHWVQCSNLQRACPVFDGDTRVTMIQVQPFTSGQEIPWPILQAKLQEEAPAFLRTLIDLNIPQSDGRLRIPVVESEDKVRAIEFTRDELQTFLAEHCFDAPGHRVPFSQFYDKFMETLGMAERGKWTKNKVSTALPPKYPRGNGTDNVVFIGNIALEQVEIPEDARPLIRVGTRLISS